MLSLATTFVDVSLKYHREVHPSFSYRRPCTSPRQREGHRCHRGDSCGSATTALGSFGHIPGCWVLTSFAEALLRAAPMGDGAGDVWPAHSPLTLMSPPGD